MILTNPDQRALDALDPADYRRRHTPTPPPRDWMAEAIAAAARDEEEREAELQEMWAAEEREAATRALTVQPEHRAAA